LLLFVQSQPVAYNGSDFSCGAAAEHLTWAQSAGRADSYKSLLGSDLAL
jgi:hypothetical protein